MGRINPSVAGLILHFLAGAEAWPQRITSAINARGKTKTKTKATNSKEPAEFEAAPGIGWSDAKRNGAEDTVFIDSAHFRIYSKDKEASNALAFMEGTYECFVGNLGWRSSGLSFKDNADGGPWIKTNVYDIATLTDAAGAMGTDYDSGRAYTSVVNDFLTDPSVVIHEYGHALHYHQKTWVDQGNTGAWWETVAQWVADTYLFSDLCAPVRANKGHQNLDVWPDYDPDRAIGHSYQVLVDGASASYNHYDAFPFFTYLTNNPDKIAGLGADTLRQMMLQYSPGSDETPLHTLQRVIGAASSGVTVSQIVGKYWARMAHVDIKHAKLQEAFLSQKQNIAYNDVQASGAGFAPKKGRGARYMGANIVQLKVSGPTVAVVVSSQGEYTATLAIKDSAGTVRYVELKGGKGEAEVAKGDEVVLVVANTPAELITYNPFELTDEVNKGLNYSFTLNGATLA